MNTVVKIDPKDIDAIAFQEASLDIWDKKYRLTAKDGAPIDKTMDDILKKVHEAGLTLKAGCVAPGTWVRTEKGLVTADQAVYEKHKEILCYDREAHQFEMRPILAHMTTHVAPDENIRITSNGV